MHAAIVLASLLELWRIVQYRSCRISRNGSSRLEEDKSLGAKDKVKSSHNWLSRS